MRWGDAISALRLKWKQAVYAVNSYLNVFLKGVAHARLATALASESFWGVRGRV